MEWVENWIDGMGWDGMSRGMKEEWEGEWRIGGREGVGV